MRFRSLIFTELILWLILLPALNGPAAADSMAWTNNQAMLVFFEAATKIKKHALKSPGTERIVTSALKAYMKRHDPYGDYLSPDEYQLWKQARQFSYQGVGMEIIEQDGRIYCLPKPLSPAEAAGVQQGDQLLAVDGSKVSGRSIYWVGSRIRGEKNTHVTLSVDRRGMPHQFTMKRKSLKDRSVWLTMSGGLDIIRINHFSPQSLAEIKAILQQRDPDRKLVLDLRSNPGGDLFAAVDIAGLFLPRGSKVLTIETSRGQVTYTAKGRIWNGIRLGLWQNEFTASASEVLIAGLMGNNKAVSLGTRSFGKAMTQKVIELSNGSALVISRGRLTGPKGRSWQDTGLRPTYNIKNYDQTDAAGSPGPSGSSDLSDSLWAWKTSPHLK